MRFRNALKKDIPALKGIDEVSAMSDSIAGKKFYVLRSEGVLQYFMRRRGIFVAEEGRKIVGYLLSHPAEWMHGVDKLIWIEHIGVHPDYRRKGLGLKMLAFAKKRYKGRAKCLFAGIHPLNKQSLSLFKKFKAGFYKRVLVFKKL